MVKEIVRDTFFLAQRSEPADKEDVQVMVEVQNARQEMNKTKDEAV